MELYYFIALAALLSAIVAWQALLPLVSETNYGDGATALRDPLLDHKERCVQILRDLELDHSTDKVSKEEYSRMKASVSAELATILEKLDERERH